jgi:hypothetical protein
VVYQLTEKCLGSWLHTIIRVHLSSVPNGGGAGGGAFTASLHDLLLEAVGNLGNVARGFGGVGESLKRV